MITFLLLISPLVYFIFLNIISDLKHWEYAKEIARNEGIRQYIPALFWSYFYDKTYITSIGKYRPNVLSFTEYVMRNHHNSVPGFNVTVNCHKDVLVMVFTTPKHISETLYFYHNEVKANTKVLLIPPYHVRLFEIYRKKHLTTTN